MCAVLTVRRFPKGTFEEALKTSLSTSTPLSLGFLYFSASYAIQLTIHFANQSVR